VTSVISPSPVTGLYRSPKTTCSLSSFSLSFNRRRAGNCSCPHSFVLSHNALPVSFRFFPLIGYSRGCWSSPSIFFTNAVFFTNRFMNLLPPLFNSTWVSVFRGRYFCPSFSSFPPPLFVVPVPPSFQTSRLTSFCLGVDLWPSMVCTPILRLLPFLRPWAHVFCRGPDVT